MSSKRDVWTEFLNATNQDESRKEANLVILGNSKTSCLSILDSLLETLGQPSIKNRDTDIMNYTYTTVGYPNRRNTSGDYLGVIQVYTVTKESVVDYLCHSLQEGCLDSIFFVIAVDFRETPFLLTQIHKWIDVIIKIVNTLTKWNPEAEQKVKADFAQRVLSLVQSTSAEDDSAADKTIDSKHVTVLPRGLLEKNIGVPFMVVCTNTEAMTQSKQFGESTLDFIQRSIRRITLQYAASLAYVNSLKKKSIPLVLSHIQSIFFPQHYTSPPADFTSFDELFVPMGSDNAYLIDDLITDPKLSAITDYNAVIELPPPSTKRTVVEKTKLESEEEFLASLLPGGERGEPGPRPSRKSVLPTRGEGIKPRISMQQKGRETPGSQPAMPSGNENTTRSFFENLMNGGGMRAVSFPERV